MMAMPSFAQLSEFENTLGAWYMLFYNKQFGEGPWGFQGDYQARYFDFEGDFEQILIRNGLTYEWEGQGLLTLGYANIRTGVFGLEDSETLEHRAYLELLTPRGLNGRILNDRVFNGRVFNGRISVNQRLRYELRWIEDQDIKIRQRYNWFVNCALNNKTIEVGTIYLSLYGEFFWGGLDLLRLPDRTRLYSALGYKFSEEYKVQLGVMRQIVNGVGKHQVQVSIHGSL